MQVWRPNLQFVDRGAGISIGGRVAPKRGGSGWHLLERAGCGYISDLENRPGGEIGRRASLRCWWAQALAGSNPVPGNDNFVIIGDSY